MILTGMQILQEIKNKKIVIRPFLEENLNPNSYNYLLGDKYLIFNQNMNDSFIHCHYLTIPEDGLLMKPGNLYLMHTHEKIGSQNFMVSLIGRSSVGRMGIFVTLSTDMGNFGKAHKWTLEVYCIHPIIVYPKMKIGQVSFWKPLGKIRKYSGSYSNYDLPKANSNLL